MAAEHLPHIGLTISGERPLAGIYIEDDEDAVRYLPDDEESQSSDPGRTMPSADAQAALSVIGAWADLDWNELADGLDRQRHEAIPTPPIDLRDL